MRPVSDRYLEALRGGHLMDAEVDVLDDDGRAIATLPAVEGYVRIDDSASHRRSVDVTVQDTGRLVPRDPTHMIGPIRGRVRVRRGVRYPAGQHVGLLATPATFTRHGDMQGVVTDSEGSLTLG